MFDKGQLQLCDCPFACDRPKVSSILTCSNERGSKNPCNSLNRNFIVTRANREFGSMCNYGNPRQRICKAATTRRLWRVQGRSGATETNVSHHVAHRYLRWCLLCRPICEPFHHRMAPLINGSCHLGSAVLAIYRFSVFACEFSASPF